MSAPIKRAVLSFSRDLEFATEPELAKRMGCSQHYWLRATLKELIDNSLDAAEEAGIDPEITITAGSVITVADNGPGMAPELVERLCVRSERTSTREAFAACDRGSQGNAVPVIMSLGFGFGGEESGITITSQGVEHAITLRVNRLNGCIDLERVTSEVPSAPGTSISLPWLSNLLDVGAVIHHHALLNPHAVFRIRGDLGDLDSASCLPVTKWTPGQPIPAHWYTRERFAHRVLLEIRNDPKITVAQFLATFKGITSSVKRSQVASRRRPLLPAASDAPGRLRDRARPGTHQHPADGHAEGQQAAQARRAWRGR